MYCVCIVSLVRCYLYVLNVNGSEWYTMNRAQHVTTVDGICRELGIPFPWPTNRDRVNIKTMTTWLTNRGYVVDMLGPNICASYVNVMRELKVGKYRGFNLDEVDTKCVATELRRHRLTMDEIGSVIGTELDVNRINRARALILLGCIDTPESIRAARKVALLDAHNDKGGNSEYFIIIHYAIDTLRR